MDPATTLVMAMAPALAMALASAVAMALASAEISAADPDLALALALAPTLASAVASAVAMATCKSTPQFCGKPHRNVPPLWHARGEGIFNSSKVQGIPFVWRELRALSKPAKQACSPSAWKIKDKGHDPTS